jgi:ABC-type sugar transport system ATPase subunit
VSDVVIQKLCKSFGVTEVLKDIDLCVEDGEFVVLVGPSGCGKSTLLRAIAGLEPINSGVMTIGGGKVNDLPPSKREIAMVFQSYALYPHLNVFDNMAFGLKFAKVPKHEIERRVGEATRILKLEAYLKRKPRELSGGQRQRVAIGRAIVRQPKVFLFDEPLSNLDAALRINTRVEIAKLHKLLKATIVYVTHDQVEAMTLADKIVVMNNGRIEQSGKPMYLYHHPANVFVASFIGSPAMNFLKGRFAADGTLDFGSGPGLNLPNHFNIKNGDEVTLGCRPEHASLVNAGEGDTDGILELAERLGDLGYAYVKLPGGQTLVCEIRGDRTLETGAVHGVKFASQSVHLFDTNGVRIPQTTS